MRNTIVNVFTTKTSPRSLYPTYIPRAARSVPPPSSPKLPIPLPLFPPLSMFMFYHVQQRVWLCDFDEFGLAEDRKKQSASMYPPNHVETCILPLLLSNTYLLLSHHLSHSHPLSFVLSHQNSFFLLFFFFVQLSIYPSSLSFSCHISLLWFVYLVYNILKQRLCVYVYVVCIVL